MGRDAAARRPLASTIVVPLKARSDGEARRPYLCPRYTSPSVLSASSAVQISVAAALHSVIRHSFPTPCHCGLRRRVLSVLVMKCRLLSLLPAACFAGLQSLAAAEADRIVYPEAAKGSQTDDYFGTKVSDPY